MEVPGEIIMVAHSQEIIMVAHSQDLKTRWINNPFLVGMVNWKQGYLKFISNHKEIIMMDRHHKN